MQRKSMPEAVEEEPAPVADAAVEYPTGNRLPPPQSILPFQLQTLMPSFAAPAPAGSGSYSVGYVAAPAAPVQLPTAYARAAPSVKSGTYAQLASDESRAV